MNALDIPCPHCRAAIGENCRNYKRKGCAPHADRVKAANPDQAVRQRAAKFAEQKNAKLAAEIPLFVDQVPTVTPDDEYRRLRSWYAAAPDMNPAIKIGPTWMMAETLLDTLKVQRLKRVAREHIPAGNFSALDAMSTPYKIMLWLDALTGSRPILCMAERIVEYGPFPVRRDDGTVIMVMSDRVTLNETDTWPHAGYVPPFTRDELKAMIADPEPLDHPGAVDPQWRVAELVK